MKTLSALVSLVSFALYVQAMPAPVTHLSDSELVFFKFSDLLEQLEVQFYTQAISKFKAADFAAAGFESDPVELIQRVNPQEIAHETFLSGMVKDAGQSPLTCRFNLDGVLKDAKSAMAFARTAEQAGTSTFSGAAHLLTDPSIMTKIVTIVADDARHSSGFNIASGSFPYPAAYDVALNANEALALVKPLLDQSCNTGVQGNRVLTITNPDPVKAGTLVTFSSGAFNASTPNLFCQIIAGDTTEAISMPLNNCIMPDAKMVNGPAFIWATVDSTPLPNDVIARSKSQVVAGPALVFVDN